MSHSPYYELEIVEAEIEAGRHRDVIGGMWDQMGRHQLDFLISQGLQPSSRLLDIGCGSLRLGALAVRWLDAERYYGTDISEALITAGRANELTAEDRAKAPISHFAVTHDFDCDFLTEPMDFAMAQSVFTHLPLNHFRRCLTRLAPHMRPGGRVFITYFPCGDDVDVTQPLIHPAFGVVSHDYKDPYHYRVGDLTWAVRDQPWEVEPIGDWGHPRGQHIVAYRRK